MAGKKADRFLDAGVDVASVNHNKIGITTQYAGYDAAKMVADVNGVFRNGSMQDLHEVYDSTFETECLHNFKYGKQAKLPSNARHDAIQQYKFFSRFKRSPIKHMLLAQAARDPDVATRAFFEQMGAAGASLEDLNKLMEMSKSELSAHGFDRDMGKVKQWLDVHKLVRYIKKDWDFAGERTSNWRDCPWPADDVDYMQMQSHAQLSRVPLASFAIPQLFKLNLARKQLQVRKYREKIPGPPKRFMLLIDDSGSMTSHVNKTIEGQTYSGVAWAIAIAIAITQAAEGVDNKVAIGLFNYSVHAADGQKWFEGNARQAEEFLWKVAWRGGGTDVCGAVSEANTYHTRKEAVEALIMISDFGANSDDRVKPLMPFYAVNTEGDAYDAWRWAQEVATKTILLSQVHIEKPKA